MMLQSQFHSPPTATGWLQEAGLWSKANTIQTVCKQHSEAAKRISYPLNPSHYETKPTMKRLFEDGGFQRLVDDCFGPVLTNPDDGHQACWLDACNKKPHGPDAEALFELLSPTGDFIKLLTTISQPPLNFVANVRDYWRNEKKAAEDKTPKGAFHHVFDVPLRVRQGRRRAGEGQPEPK